MPYSKWPRDHENHEPYREQYSTPREWLPEQEPEPATCRLDSCVHPEIGIRPVIKYLRKSSMLFRRCAITKLHRRSGCSLRPRRLGAR